MQVCRAVCLLWWKGLMSAIASWARACMPLTVLCSNAARPAPDPWTPSRVNNASAGLE